MNMQLRNYLRDASLDFVSFTQHALLRGAEAQSVLVNRFPYANFSGLVQNVRRRTGIAASKAETK
jgi:hypothetical protein